MSDVDITDTVHIPQQARPADAREQAQAYLDAWNAHDGAALAALVTGTYRDPTLPEPLRGPAIAAMVDSLCAAFPDLSFTPVSEPLVDGDRMLVEWRMRGTNDGAPLPGAPEPTGGTVDLPGVDVITFRDGRLVDVVGYFDQKAFIEQLGLQTFVAPADAWPVSHGTAMRVDLDLRAAPGALTFTWIDVADDAEQAELYRRSTDIVTALAGEPGFLGFGASSVGRRNTTLTLWTTPEAAESALARNAPHRQAMETVGTGFGTRGFTGIWQPQRLNVQFVRCPDCGARNDAAPAGSTVTCACGTTSETTPYL